ncbi:gamma-glutamyltransferase 1 [Hoeflea marina]|uniref:Glutathione hydrolase proenzyme n=1 Tax=Hoeflea marina TaxID=274592 RepID=A0A317PI62_9HYPH|nr:gamma-glutamyltransferase [Hoeflea marina]PWW00122.1 gamma-glutamyltransferase 1 [Hoeflea marina]
MRRLLLAAVLVLALPALASAQQAADTVAPEGATPSFAIRPDAVAPRPIVDPAIPAAPGTETQRSGDRDAAMTPNAAAPSPEVEAALAAKAAGVPVEADRWMIAAANPLAAEAGAAVLRSGGSAADALVAVQAVLGLVEPQSSGLGGGAFLVWFDAATGRIETLDGRETAPMAATPTLFQDAAGEPLQFYDAVVGGRSVGTPGTPLLLETAHRKWGRANWADLFDDAIRLAETGFEVSPRMAAAIAGDAERIGRYPAAREYFLPGGAPLAAGAWLRNPDYAAALRRLAADGARVFYEGEMAQDIVAAVRTAAGNPGVLSLADLAGYRVRQRPPVCVHYRIYDVCGMGPPSSGGLTVGQILKMIEPHDIAALGPESPEAWRLIGDASRLAFADRGRYMADTDFVPMPVKGLVDPAYLAARSVLLGGDRALTTVEPGMPPFDHAMLADDRSIELPSTSHIVIVDAAGNALSMTTTIENSFGSRLMTHGFLLNNELTDFSFRTHENGVPIANRVEPGKRPRSSMAPTILLKDGRPVLVIGSPGGSSIIGYMAQALIGFIDWDMDVQQTVSQPHALNRFGTFELEAGTQAATLQLPLEAMGFTVQVTELNSGLQAIAIGEGRDGRPRLTGGADPRREGIALGE